MNIKNNNLLKSVIYLTLSTSLVACGSSAENALNGVAINSTNYLALLQTGFKGSVDSIGAVLYGGATIDRSSLGIIESDDNNITYQCDNEGGSFTATQITSDSEGLNFTDCEIIDSFSDSTRYDGVITITTNVHSGEITDIGNYDADWNVTQSMTMTNFTQTSPADGGDTYSANGDYTLDSSNDISTSLNKGVLKSTNLMIDTIKVNPASSTSYSFSDIYYDIQGDTSDESSLVDIDFTADISGLGDVQVTTEPALDTDISDIIQSGTITLDTGNSSVRIEALGNDNLEISLDYDNNGSYDFNIPTTFSDTFN